jgi:hypothetical protein
MALDSNGNIAVDFVWGNKPLQPDTERNQVPQGHVFEFGGHVYLNNSSQNMNPIGPGEKVMFYDMNASSSDLFTPDNIKVGDVLTANFEYNGVNPAKFTVTGVQVDEMFGKVFNIFTDTAYSMTSPTPPTNATLTKAAPSIQIGGGEGDYGWSPTTKVISGLLDPALDGHNITTEFWNNFPGYTPNVGFVPQELIRFTTTGAYSVQFSVDRNDDNPYYQTRQGFIISIYNGGASVEDRNELKALITAGSLAGQRVPAIEYLDAYLNTKSTPEGWVVGADYSDDAYGSYNITIQVQTVANAFTQMDYPAAGTEIAIGVGTAKSVLWQGVNGTDYSVAYLHGGAAYGQTPGFSIRGSQYGNQQTDMSDLVALANSGELVGAYIGLGVINEGSPYNYGDASYHKYNITKIDSVTVNSDGYGNYVVDVMTDTFGWSSGYYEFSDYQDGSSIVIIK